MLLPLPALQMPRYCKTYHEVSFSSAFLLSHAAVRDKKTLSPYFYRHKVSVYKAQSCFSVLSELSFCLTPCQYLAEVTTSWWRRQWRPTPVLLPGKSHGRRCLVGCSPWLRVGHDWATSLSLFTFMHWRRKWQSTPVMLPGESQGRRILVGCRLWGHTESDTTEAT